MDACLLPIFRRYKVKYLSNWIAQGWLMLSLQVTLQSFCAACRPTDNFADFTCLFWSHYVLAGQSISDIFNKTLWRQLNFLKLNTAEYEILLFWWNVAPSLYRFCAVSSTFTSISSTAITFEVIYNQFAVWITYLPTYLFAWRIASRLQENTGTQIAGCTMV